MHVLSLSGHALPQLRDESVTSLRVPAVIGIRLRPGPQGQAGLRLPA
jgi:hypothetical protein